MRTPLRSASHSRPPYCSFRIGGQRKFFLKAKWPSVSLKDDASPAYQFRLYAWSAKLPLFILTGFEELAIYDCRQYCSVIACQNRATQTTREVVTIFAELLPPYPRCCNGGFGGLSPLLSFFLSL